jgi:magnesium transporter
MEPYFRDLEGLLERLLDQLASGKEAVNGAFDIYVSRMSHRSNQVMQLLTIVSTVLLPMTVILGFFGTNFQFDVLYTSATFAVMLLIMLLVSGSLLFGFYRRGWVTQRAIQPSLDE